MNNKHISIIIYSGWVVSVLLVFGYLAWVMPHINSRGYKVGQEIQFENDLKIVEFKLAKAELVDRFNGQVMNVNEDSVEFSILDSIPNPLAEFPLVRKAVITPQTQLIKRVADKNGINQDSQISLKEITVGSYIYVLPVKLPVHNLKEFQAQQIILFPTP